MICCGFGSLAEATVAGACVVDCVVAVDADVAIVDVVRIVAIGLPVLNGWKRFRVFGNRWFSLLFS